MAGTKISVRPKRNKPSTYTSRKGSSENVAPRGASKDSATANKKPRVAKGFYIPKRVPSSESNSSSDGRTGLGMPEFHKNATLKAIEKNMRAPTTSFGGSSLQNVASLEAKLNHLQKKYKDLKAIRYTEPERLLNNLQEKYNERDQLQTDQIETWAARTSELKARLQKLEGHGEHFGDSNNVEQLKVKINKLRERLTKVEEERDAVLNSLSAQSSNSESVGLGSFGVNGSVSSEKKIVAFYKLLTSLSLEAKPKSNNMFTCKGISLATNQEVIFEIGLVNGNNGTKEMVYSPILNSQCLPPHFRDDISFELKVAPLFFSQIATALLQS